MFTPVTLTRTYQDAAGNPLSGTVSVRPRVPMANGGITIGAVPVTTELVEGILSVRVLATTDPDTMPINNSYEVIETFAGQNKNTYTIVVPHDQGETLDLSTLHTTDKPEPMYAARWA